MHSGLAGDNTNAMPCASESEQLCGNRRRLISQSAVSSKGICGRWERISTVRLRASALPTVLRLRAGTWHRLCLAPWPSYHGWVMTVRARPMFLLTLAIVMAIAGVRKYSLGIAH